MLEVHKQPTFFILSALKLEKLTEVQNDNLWIKEHYVTSGAGILSSKVDQAHYKCLVDIRNKSWWLGKKVPPKTFLKENTCALKN